jgi:serine/threonine protein phosphatase PrpC
MKWLTIGAFARAARLTPKALRLYDDLGLLPPALLVRALGATGGADISLRTALAGDRYLLCSDGLSAVVDPAAVAGALAAGEPGEVVDRLIELAHEAGAPDNIAVVVADVVAG